MLDISVMYGGLYQLCLDNGYTPNQWKVAHITPVYKKRQQERTNKL